MLDYIQNKLKSQATPKQNIHLHERVNKSNPKGASINLNYFKAQSRFDFNKPIHSSLWHIFFMFSDPCLNQHIALCHFGTALLQTQDETWYHFCIVHLTASCFLSFLAAAVYMAWLRGSAGRKNIDRKYIRYKAG